MAAIQQRPLFTRSPASEPFDHDALVTAVTCCWYSDSVSHSLLARLRTSQQPPHF